MEGIDSSGNGGGFKDIGSLGNGGGGCEGVNPSGDGDEECKGAGSSGNCGGDSECEGVGPSGGGGSGGEGVEGVDPSDPGSPRSFDVAGFLTTIGTATWSCVSRISRTTGAPRIRLKMERTRRI